MVVLFLAVLSKRSESPGYQRRIRVRRLDRWVAGDVVLAWARVDFAGKLRVKLYALI